MPKQKDGRYRAKVTVGHDSDGRSIVKYASGRTKKELEAAKEELRKAYITGNYDIRRDTLFEVYAKEWYLTYKKPHISRSSQDNYTAVLNNQILPALAGKQIRAITAPELQRLMNSLQGMGKTTIGYANTIIRSVFNMAYANGIIDRDPSTALKKPSAEKESKRALTGAETAAALKVGREHPEGLLLLILYYTGLRRGEALGLQWQDIDFTNRMIFVRRDIDFITRTVGTLKSSASERQVPLPDELSKALWPLRGFGETFIIQSPMTHGHLTTSTFNRRWQRLMCALYLADPEIENIVIKEHTDKDGNLVQSRASVLTPHFFRHNYASVLYNAGVDILAAQEFLGHADVKTTLSIYAHLGADRKMENADKVRVALSGNFQAT